ncbi:hypothetical protein D3C87_1749940 [compost metagenome]
MDILSKESFNVATSSLIHFNTAAGVAFSGVGNFLNSEIRSPFELKIQALMLVPPISIDKMLVLFLYFLVTGMFCLLNKKRPVR